VSRGGDRVDPEEIEAMSSERCVRFQESSLHANVAVPRNRQRLERLIPRCRVEPQLRPTLSPRARRVARDCPVARRVR